VTEGIEMVLAERAAVAFFPVVVELIVSSIAVEIVVGRGVEGNFCWELVCKNMFTQQKNKIPKPRSNFMKNM
jgi:hypothetical protein